MSQEETDFLDVLPDRRLRFHEGNKLAQTDPIFAVDKIVDGPSGLVEGLIIVSVDLYVDGFFFSDDRGEWVHVESGTTEEVGQVAEAVEEALERGEAP